jgi:hypothetical protein
VADTRGIDRVFDLVDSVVDKADRVLNRAKYTEDTHKIRHASKKVIGTEEVKASPLPSTATAIVTRQFRIIEAVDSESGITIFVVTNGGQRAECSTRELAEKILCMLEAVP